MQEPQRPRLGRDHALVATAAVLWGSWSLFLRPAALDARWTSVVVFAAMAGVGAPLLGPRAARGRSRRPARAWALLALIGVFDAANVALFFGAIARTTVAVAVLSHYLAPALVSLVAPPLVGTPRVRGSVGRALLATAGLLLVLEPWRLAGGPAGGAATGAAFGAGSAVFYALNVCLSKRAASHFTAEEQLVYHCALSGLILLPFAPWGAMPGAHGVLLTLAAGALIGVTAAVLFVRGLAKIPAEHASLLTFLEPLTAVLLGVARWHEPLRPIAIVGALVVVGAGVAAVRAR